MAAGSSPCGPKDQDFGEDIMNTRNATRRGFLWSGPVSPAAGLAAPACLRAQTAPFEAGPPRCASAGTGFPGSAAHRSITSGSGSPTSRSRGGPWPGENVSAIASKRFRATSRGCWSNTTSTCAVRYRGCEEGET